MLSIFRKKRSFFTEEETKLIVKAIRHAEHQTSGEVRVFVESRCSWVDAIDRAAEVFFALKMDKTEQRNAVIVYVAVKDRQLAVFGDEGIHNKVGHCVLEQSSWLKCWPALIRTIMQKVSATV
jgi:uncharacterized membrane protein